MLLQTKRAIENLLDAGLKRNEFRVRTPWNAKYQGYGDTEIVLFCKTERAVEVAPKLAEHFEVVESAIDGVVRHVSVIDGVPGLKIENI